MAKPNPLETPQQELGVARREAGAVSRPQEMTVGGVDMKSLFEAAIKQGSAMDVIKELRQMEEAVHARTAKAMFDEAMRAFKSECPTISKDKGVPDRSGKTAYKYCPLEIIELQIRPFEDKHGLYHTFDTDTTAPDGWVVQRCIVKHVGGHSEESVGKFRLGTKTQLMSDTQVDAAAQSFANRYALKNAYGLVLVGDDIDMNTNRVKPAGPSSMRPDTSDLKPLAQELWDLLKPVRGDKPNWLMANQWLWREDILDGAVPEEAPHLTAEKFKTTIAKAKQKIGSK